MYDKASLALIPSGYKSGTLYSVLPANGDGDFTHTRASSATRVNKDGLIESVASGVPRLDYPLIDGVVQSCPALLLEPSRTNSLAYSEDFSNWTAAFSNVTTDQAVSPDGNTTADEVENSGVSSFGRVEKTLSLTSGSNVFYSLFVKNNGYDTVTIRIEGTNVGGSGNTNATYDFVYSTETISRRIGGTATSTLVEDYGNGWYRIGIEVTNSTITKAVVYPSYGNTQTNSHYLWGAQVEVGSYPTSYIPTTTAAVTRSADVCNGAGTTAEFNDSEGVLFAEIAAIADDQSNRRITISDGTNNNRIVTGYNTVSNRIFAFVVASGSTVASFTYNVTDETEYHKVAVKYKNNDFAFWVDGVERATDTSGSTPSGLDSLQFEQGSGGALYFYGKTKQLIVFNEALSDSELQALTSN